MIYTPTFAEVLEVSQSRGRNSENPGAWAGLRGAWTGLQGGGKTWFDVSGYGNQGAINGPTWAIGPNGPVLRFAGNTQDDYVLLNEPIVLSTYTLIARVKVTDYADSRTIVANDDAQNNTWRLSSVSCNHIVDGNSETSTQATILAGEWHQVGLTKVANSLTYWVDGVSVGIDTFGVANPVFTISQFGLTGQLPPTFNYDEFDGDIESISVWNRALAPAEIKQLYDKPAAMFTRRTITYFPSAVAPPATTTPWWFRHNILQTG